MPREGPERRRDHPDFDEREQSMARKIARVEVTSNPIVDALIRAVLMLALGGGGTYLANEHRNVQDTENETAIKNLKLEFDQFTDKYWKRYREDNAQMDAVKKEYDHDITVLETKVEILERRVR